MKKQIAAAVAAAPTHAVVGVTAKEVTDNLRVVDAKTGEEIARVIEADSDAGKVRRFDVKDGNLVREGDHFKLIEEDREIRIEWTNPPEPDAADAGTIEGEG